MASETWTALPELPTHREPERRVIRGQMMTSEPTDSVTVLIDGREVNALYSHTRQEFFEPYGPPLDGVTAWRMS